MKFDRRTQKFYKELGQGSVDAMPRQEKIKLTPWRVTLLMLLICSPLVFFLIKFGMHLLTVRVSGYIAVPQIEVRANEDGYIANISVKSGQRIKAGEFLCRLDQPELKKKESLIKSELDYLQHNPSAKDIKNRDSIKHVNLNFAISQKVYMKKRLDEVTQLFNRGAATDAEVKFSRFQYEETLVHLADLEAAIARAKATTRMMQSAEIGQEALRIKELVLERKKLDLQAKALAIFSPIPGSISDILAVEGSYVSRGDLIFTLTKNEKIYITAYLAPDNIDYAVAGRSAKIMFADGEKVSAKVLEASKVAKLTPLNKPNLSGIESNEVMIQLEFMQPIKQKLINGLPVEIFF